MKKNKIIASQVLHLSVLMLAVFLLFGSPLQTFAAHTHQYQITILKEPTCTEKGQQLFQCECGYSYTKEIQPLGHDTNKMEQIEPSCEKEGQVIYQCSRCLKKTIEPIPAKVHRPGTWKQTIKPGFFQSGKSTIQCERCHKQLQSKILKPICPVPLAGLLGILVLCIAFVCSVFLLFKKKRKK